MTPDTPLVEVVNHLPREAATLLDPMSVETQEAVLTQIRTTVSIWEAKGLVFDPVTYETFLIALVAAIAPLHCAYLNLNRIAEDALGKAQEATDYAQHLSHQLQEAQSKVRAAEALVEALTARREKQR